MAKFFIGVDGGGTKTRALVVDANGNVLGSSLKGASNPNSVGKAAAKENLITAMQDALAAANVTEPVTAFCGISGVNDHRTAREFENKILQDGRIQFEKLRIENDTRSLCAAAFGLESGIVIIAGTGSKCYGRTTDGKEWETGGYDFHVSDEGSAFDLARSGIRAAVRAADGRGPDTILREIIFKELQIEEVGQISQRLHQNSLKKPGFAMTKDEIAALAILVDKAAVAGDAVAREILDNAMHDLVLMVKTVAQKTEMDKIKTLRVGITGGVITHEPCASLFKKALEKDFPGCEIFKPEEEPVVGATIRARAL
ncbi:MAG: hypothetical protein K6B46_01800 [Opitutales bacterium]|nr:hypothetical protein [Opitutales bacterium]